MAAYSRWVVLPAYPWTAVTKDAVLTSKLKNLYNKPVRTMTMALFPWPVRLVLGDQFSPPGREKSSRRQGTNILEMSSTVRDPKQAAVNVVILRCQESLASDASKTLDAEERSAVQAWLNSWLVHRSNSSKCELLYDEMISKRMREAAIVRERRDATERIVREAMGPSDAAGTGVEPVATAPTPTPASVLPLASDKKKDKERQRLLASPKLYTPSGGYARGGGTEEADDDDDDGDSGDAADRNGDVEEDYVSSLLDELKVEHTDLVRLEEVVELEKKGRIHFAKSLAKYSKALIAVYLVSALLCGISGDGWEIMINFFAAGVVGVWGLMVALNPEKYVLHLFTIVVMLDGLFLYPLHVILRATIFDNDPEAYLNGEVIASVVLIEMVLFVMVVYAVSFSGVAQRIKTTLRLLLPPPPQPRIAAVSVTHKK